MGSEVCGHLCPVCDSEPAWSIELPAKVRLMRDLGVLEWDGIKLGAAPATTPAPVPRKTEPVDAKETAIQEKRRKYLRELGYEPPREMLERLP